MRCSKCDDALLLRQTKLYIMLLRAFILLILPIFSSATQAASICHVGEKAYFRCSFSGKTAVLCGASDKDTGRKLFQYRIYKRGKTEMQYPSSSGASEPQFLQSSILLAHGGEIRVSFGIAEYKYVLYETWDTRSPSHGGIYVLRNGKLVQQIQCDDYADPNASLLESGIKKLLQQEEYVDFYAPGNPS